VSSFALSDVDILYVLNVLVYIVFIDGVTVGYNKWTKQTTKISCTPKNSKWCSEWCAV